MTGVFATDHSYGSRTHLMNLKTRQWDGRLLEIFGLEEEKLCPLCSPGSVVGSVTETFARICGLRPGIPVISAGGDQQCGALGLGVLESGMAEINCGTGAFAVALTDHADQVPGCICNVSAIPDRYIVEANILTGAASVNWFRDLMAPDLAGTADAFETLNALAEAVPMGANGVYCLPHFQGCGARAWNVPAKAAFWGMTLSTGRGELLRALYEGLAAEVAKSLVGMPIGEEQCLFAGGGLSKSHVYMQILADMTNHAIRCYDDPQATAIGAYVSAAVTLGAAESYAQALERVRAGGQTFVYEPDIRAVEFYRGYRAETERVFSHLWKQ